MRSSLYYHDITHEDEKNGDGIRTVLWVSGCEHHCPGCQNPQTWEYNSGIPFDKNALNEILTSLKPDYITGITFSGGDPLHPNNLEEVLHLCMIIKRIRADKTIWLYTGYTYECLLSCKNFYFKEILKLVDVLVDGRYDETLRDVELKWRGSSNQRVIDVQKSLKSGEVVLHCD